MSTTFLSSSSAIFKTFGVRMILKNWGLFVLISAIETLCCFTKGLCITSRNWFYKLCTLTHRVALLADSCPSLKLFSTFSRLFYASFRKWASKQSRWRCQFCTVVKLRATNAWARKAILRFSQIILCWIDFQSIIRIRCLDSVTSLRTIHYLVFMGHAGNPPINLLLMGTSFIKRMENCSLPKKNKAAN